MERRVHASILKISQKMKVSERGGQQGKERIRTGRRSHPEAIGAFVEPEPTDVVDGLAELVALFSVRDMEVQP